jgi:hypothetical protein
MTKGLAQMVEYLPSNLKTWVEIPVLPKQNKKGKKQELTRLGNTCIFICLREISKFLLLNLLPNNTSNKSAKTMFLPK